MLILQHYSKNRKIERFNKKLKSCEVYTKILIALQQLFSMVMCSIIICITRKTVVNQESCISIKYSFAGLITQNFQGNSLLFNDFWSISHPLEFFPKNK